MPEREKDRNAPRLQLNVTVEVDPLDLERRPVKQDGPAGEARKDSGKHALPDGRSRGEREATFS